MDEILYPEFLKRLAAYCTVNTREYFPTPKENNLWRFL
jgi:hypothetical protein